MKRKKEKGPEGNDLVIKGTATESLYKKTGKREGSKFSRNGRYLYPALVFPNSP